MADLDVTPARGGEILAGHVLAGRPITVFGRRYVAEAPLRVRISLVGVLPHHLDVEWPGGWPPPAQGDAVSVAGVEEPDASTLYARRVDWHPMGDPDDPEDRTPYVYVVVGPARPGS